MAISQVVVVACCLCAVASISSSVSVAREQIVFSGAIVEPTCGVPSAEMTLAAAAQGRMSKRGRWGCAQHGLPQRASQMYVLTAERLSSSVQDRVLKYFDAYVKASRPDAVDPVLLTQTYE